MGYVNGIDLHREMMYRGRNIILDASYIDNDTIEIMCMDAEDSTKEYECKRTNDPDEAERIYGSIRYSYSDQPHKKLSGKYAKLRDDLIKVLEIGRQHDQGEDGGTCNFDAPSIVGNGWRESMVKQAAKEAGTTVRKWKLYSDTRWVFGVPTMGQGNRRCRVSEAMCEVLSDLGYDVLEYSAMD